MTEFFQGIATWYLANLNFGTIVLFMGIESTFLPFPSEIIIPPAAFQAPGIPELLLVIAAGVLGSLCGALINYSLSIWIGRPLIYKFAGSKLGRLCLLTPEKVEKAEKYFIKFGRSATFIGRLVPGIRHLISIPAGLARMPLGQFILYTFMGSTLWCTILGVTGYLLKGQKQLFEQYFTEITWGMIALAVGFIAFILLKVFVFGKKKTGEHNPS